jgi:tRNA (guanine37-N1)-methyltransferase
MFPGPLASGLYKKALDKKIWSLEIINIRDYTEDKHKTVDDTPFGGGSGMVMRADILANSLDKNISNKEETIIYLTPKGKKFDQIYAKKILKKNINIICGHFEGVDERILETRNIEEVSIGDFVLSGAKRVHL